MTVSIRQATPDDAETVSSILAEAAKWLEVSGMVMWRDGELTAASVAADVGAGLFHLAEADLEAAGTIKFQLEDKLFWPDVPAGGVGVHSPSCRSPEIRGRRRFDGHAPVGRCARAFP